MPFFNLRPVGQSRSLVTFYISKPGTKVELHPGEKDGGSLVLQASTWVQEKNLLLPGERMCASDGFVKTPSSQPANRIWAWPRRSWPEERRRIPEDWEREDWQYKHFYFVLVFPWNSEVSRCQAAVCRLEGRALWKIHTKTNFVTWMEQLPPSRCLSLSTFGTPSKILGLMRNYTPEFQNWVIFRSSSPHFL